MDIEQDARKLILNAIKIEKSMQQIEQEKKNKGVIEVSDKHYNSLRGELVSLIQ